MPRGLCNAISVACQLHKKAAAAEIGRLGVWTNHVKISVVASENALQPNEPIANHPHTFGLGNGHGVVCAVASGLGGGSHRLHLVGVCAPRGVFAAISSGLRRQSKYRGDRLRACRIRPAWWLASNGVYRSGGGKAACAPSWRGRGDLQTPARGVRAGTRGFHL